MGAKDTDRRDRLGAKGDDVYAALMAVHEGLDFEDSVKLNARLVLLMANEIADMETLERLLRQARPPT